MKKEKVCQKNNLSTYFRVKFLIRTNPKKSIKNLPLNLTKELHFFFFLLKVSSEAPPGYILIIEQAIGECNGDGTTKTEMYQISHHYKNSGEITVVG